MEALDLLVQHVAEVLQVDLFILGGLARILLAVDDLQPLQQLVLHLEDVLIVLQVVVPYLVVALEEQLEFVLEVLIFALELLIRLDEGVVEALQFGVG